MFTLKDIWEALFHWSNITHIANAHADDIWVSIYSTHFTLNETKIQLAVRGIQPTGEISTKLNQASNTSWFRVTSRRFHRYNRRTKTELMTIVRATRTNTVDEAASDHTKNIIVVNYPIHQNFSYIVTKDGDLKQQKYGSNNLFEDFSGRCHLSDRKFSSTSRAFDTSVYLSVFLGITLCCYVFRHRITSSLLFRKLQKTFKQM
ncbi:hypothetical protein I4U23_004972 [Adineta vaga]|nr:hypothetical protein I4U23_004972 [Adineta vaga]